MKRFAIRILLRLWRTAICIIFLLTSFVSLSLAQERFGSAFGGMPIKKAAKQEYKAATKYVDTLGLSVYELRVKPQAVNTGGKYQEIPDLLVFENGSPYENTTAMIIFGITDAEFNFLYTLKGILQNQTKKENGTRVSLTDDEIENLLITISKWLSDKKIK